MYVLFITRGYPFGKYKTYGVFEFDQARALAESGCKVVYAAIDLRSIRRWRKWGIVKERVSGVHVYGINIPLGRVPKRVLRRFSYWGLKILYRSIVKDHGKPDIMHAHFTGSAYTASVIKDQANVPLIITEHSSDVNKDRMNDEVYRIAKFAYNKADGLIAVSPALAGKIKQHFHQDSVYISNMVDTEIFHFEPAGEKEGFHFVSTGNLIGLKRMDLTIEAFHEAFKADPDVTLTIFGEGPERKKLEKLIHSLQLETRVRLMGLQSRKRIANTLKQSDCFVLASRSETFGVVYIEALAMGVPVIATKCGGPESFVNPSNGLLVETDNREQLVAAMEHMYKNSDRYDSRRIASETIEKFSADIISKKLIKLYENTLHAQKYR